jgi:hypothetical protein
MKDFTSAVATPIVIAINCAIIWRIGFWSWLAVTLLILTALNLQEWTVRLVKWMFCTAFHIPQRESASDRLRRIRKLMESVVCTEGCDKGVVLLDNEGRTYYDENLKGRVYYHEYFSPLGDALIHIYHLTDE